MACSPIYTDGTVALYHGDALVLLPQLVGEIDAIITDPPYGQTSLPWDRWVVGWLARLPAASLWCFGSLRMFMAHAGEFTEAGWKLSQDLVWEKHNGSGFHADRFKRVHEQPAHFYKGRWSAIYRRVPTTPTAVARVVRRKRRPPHMGHIDSAPYVSVDGGPRLMRSVLQVRSEQGRAVHPTQKPLGIVEPLIQYSVPPNGVVLDPFAGSGTTLLAARRLGRRAVGFEIDEATCATAIRRLEQVAQVETA